MRQICSRSNLAILTTLALVAFAGALEAAARAPIADFAAAGAEAVWTPREADYDHLVLTVSGPGGTYVRSEFAAGEHPTFGLFDAEGAALRDGLYKWELSLVPRVDARTRERMESARAEGALSTDGAFLASRSRQAGFFSIVNGSFVGPEAEEPAADGKSSLSVPIDPQGVVITNADGVIRNSLCVGFDCPNSPSFSDTTILMMENNTRIKFDDTSNTSSFPNRDWEIEANSNLNGGASYLGVNDCGNSSQGGCATDLVFALEANVRSSALYVESDGDVGFGTANPVVTLHAVDGNTPTLRLEQDGSSGFAPHTWDVAGNETSFFIRDATSGSTLPFRIFPGAASNSLVIDGDDEVGVGTSAPDAPLHVRRTNGTVNVHIEDTSGSAGNQEVLTLEKANAAPITRYISSFRTWDFTGGNLFTVNDPSDGNIEFSLASNGNLTIEGDYFSTTCTTPCAPDYVFEPDYELRPLDELASFIRENKHLPNVPSAEELVGPINMSKMQMTLLEKIEELTLYTLEQQATIVELQGRLARLESPDSEN